MKITKFAIHAFVLSLLSISCSDNQTPQKQPPQEITVVKVLEQDVPIYEEMVGQIFGLKDIPIRARVDGFLERISFEEGSNVKKGQLLYSIDEQPYLADVAAQRSNLVEAQTQMTKAKNELDRYIPLAEMNAVSKSDLDAAQANYDAAVASVDAAKARLRSTEINLGYCSIKAPIDGIIGKTEAREGEYVGKDPNPVILNTVSRIDTVRVIFSISESKYLELARNYRAPSEDEKDKKNVELILSDGSVYPDKGKVDFVNSQVDANTGSILIQASFPNSSKLLRPGLYGKVRVKVKTAPNALLIPQRCVMELQGKYSVFVVGDDNTVTSRPVVIGYKLGDMYLVKEGLAQGEKIVIDALQKVQPGLEVIPVETEFDSKSNTL